MRSGTEPDNGSALDVSDISAIEQVVIEAEKYNEDMEERGFHTGGPGDIEGVYDSRVYLLTNAVRALLVDREGRCSCTVAHRGKCGEPNV